MKQEEPWMDEGSRLIMKAEFWIIMKGKTLLS